MSLSCPYFSELILGGGGNVFVWWLAGRSAEKNVTKNTEILEEFFSTIIAAPLQKRASQP